MATRTISSQRYLDPAIVADKRAAADYVVLYVTLAASDGETYRVVVDGHHSLAAARADGVAPEYEAVGGELQLEADRSEDDAFLLAHQHDADWYDVDTGRDVW